MHFSVRSTGLIMALLPLRILSAEAPVPAESVETQSQQNEDVGIHEIVVTATKRIESIQTVPMSITAIEGDRLRDLGVTQVSDLAKLTPGLQYTPSPYATPIYSIRGVGYNEASVGAMPAVSVYVDEAPLPYGVMTPIATLDVERVEVLKGPQGTLFGQNSTGGAINFIAAKPTQTFAAGTDLSGNHFGGFAGTAYVSGPITPELGVRVAVKTDQGGAWQKNYTRNDTLGTANDFYGRVILSWEPQDWARISLNFNHFFDRGDQEAAQARYLTPLTPASLVANLPQLLTYPLAPSNNRAADWDPNRPPRNDNHQTQGTLRADFDVAPDTTLTSISDYVAYREDLTQDPDGISPENYEAITHAQIHSFSQELRLTGAATHDLRYIVGASYAHATVNQIDRNFFSQNSNSFLLEAFGGTIPATRDLSNQESKTYAAFANLDYNIIPTVTAHGGVRYTKHDLDYSGCSADPGDGSISPIFSALIDFVRSLSAQGPITPLAPGDCLLVDANNDPAIASGRLNQHNVSWRGGLDWQVTPDALLYVNVSRGFKAGSFPIFSASLASQLAPVTQESVLATEAGFKTELLNRTLQLNGAIFHYKYSDKQQLIHTIVPIWGGLERLINVPKSRVEGAELQAIWAPLRGLSFTYGGTYLTSRVQTGIDGTFDIAGNPIDITGESLPLTPKWQMNADAQYDWSLTSGKNLFAGVDVTWQSATEGGFGNNRVFDIGSYGLLDLRAGVRATDDRWRLFVWAHNVTDRYYWTNADRIADTSVRFAGRPRTVGATLSLRF